MVQAKELRIGNYVFFDKEENITGAITSISENRVWLQLIRSVEGRDFNQECSNDDIEAISLTPEMLEKAGFEWYRPLNHWRLVEGEQWYSVKNVLFDEPKAELLCFSWCNLSWDEASSMPPKVVNYVHQLQNLYFALVGEELEINL